WSAPFRVVRVGRWRRNDALDQLRLASALRSRRRFAAGFWWRLVDGEARSNQRPLDSGSESRGRRRRCLVVGGSARPKHQKPTDRRGGTPTTDRGGAPKTAS